MANYTIILDGDVVASKRLCQQIQNNSFIVADGAIRHVKTLNAKANMHIVPQFWIGDFDSTSPILDNEFSHLQKLTYPIEKDKTDGQLAVELAIKNGAKKLNLLGAMGGERHDHGLFHFVYALKLAKDGYKIMLTTGKQEAYPILPGVYQISAPEGTIVSLISFSDLYGLDLEGVKWPLKNKNIKFGSSWTLSNTIEKNSEKSIDDTKITIRLKKGKAILMLYLPL